MAKTPTPTDPAQAPVPAKPQPETLGGQVNAATQTHEDNGGRTLAKPTTDPGPITIDEDGVPVAGAYPGEQRANAKPIHKRFPPVTILQRVDTVGNRNLAENVMAADMVHPSGASEMYNQTGRNNDGVDPEAALSEREPAPLKE